MKTKSIATIYAILAAVLYAIKVPLSKMLLMLGIARTNSANVSLLNNFEIVATSIIALVTVASTILSFEGAGSFTFNQGSLFVLGACLCWGFVAYGLSIHFYIMAQKDLGAAKTSA